MYVHTYLDFQPHSSQNILTIQCDYCSCAALYFNQKECVVFYDSAR